MDDVDRMIIEALVRLKCTFCEDSLPSTLNVLTTENVIEGVVRFLWACDPTTNTQKLITSYKLPAHTTGRFKMATNLSNAIKKIGIREEFGYQTFLYHSIFDIRRMFLALIDKLPEESLQAEVELTDFEKLKLDLSNSIIKHLENPWVPEFCRYLRMKYDGKFWCPNEDQAEDFAFLTNLSGKKYDNRLRICQALENNEYLQQFNIPNFNKISNDFHSINFKDIQFPKNNERPPVLAKPKILPRPKVLPKPIREKIIVEDSKPTNIPPQSPSSTNSETQNSAMDQISQKMKKISEEILLKEANLETKRKELMEYRYAQIRFDESIKLLENILDSNDQRLLKLIDEPEVCIEKLEKFIEEADQRKFDLQEQFFEVKREKLAELEQIRLDQGLTKKILEERQKKEFKMEQLKAKIEESNELIRQKQRIRNKLEKEFQKISKNPISNERSKYVKRVLEIVLNVSKQNEEISKTIDSIHKIEREINSLSGNLDRTFIVVDRWLGNHSEMDSKMQKAYRLLIRMHEQCSLVKIAINERGQISRQIDELTDQIEIETQKLVDSQLEQLLSDLMQIRQENLEMNEAIKN